jgi:type I restriction enzyme S subunit
MQRYESYKPSGVKWLGDVPAHWEVRPGFTCFKENKDRNKGLLENTVLSLSYGRIVIKPEEKLTGLVPESFESYQLIKPGDIVIRTTDLQNDQTSLRVGYAKDKGMITSAYLGLRCHPEINPEYVFRLLESYDALKVFYGMGSGLRQNIDFWDFKRLPVPLPPRDEQDRIVAFLDQKTAEIDAAIAKKERLIELLEEQAAILISNAVTKGLNADVPQRDSGVAWIGHIPSHWYVKRAKFLFREIDERSANGEEELLSVSHMTGVTPRSEKTNVYMFMAEDYSGSKLCRPNDLVFNIMWAWMGALGVSDRVGIVSPSYGVYRQLKEGTFNNWYLEHLLRSTLYVAEYNKRSTGLHSSRLRLYSHMFFDMELGFPPREEQDEIERETKKQVSQANAVITSVRSEIEKLAELRSSLVASVVTGKMRV